MTEKTITGILLGHGYGLYHQTLIVSGINSKNKNVVIGLRYENIINNIKFPSEVTAKYYQIDFGMGSNPLFGMNCVYGGAQITIENVDDESKQQPKLQLSQEPYSKIKINELDVIIDDINKKRADPNVRYNVMGRVVNVDQIQYSGKTLFKMTLQSSIGSSIGIVIWNYPDDSILHVPENELIVLMNIRFAKADSTSFVFDDYSVLLHEFQDDVLTYLQNLSLDLEEKDYERKNCMYYFHSIEYLNSIHLNICYVK